MFSVWFRVIRVKFLLASVIAVSVGLALNWWQNSSIDIFDAGLTFAGVMALHASVDLLNDFWDFKRGIDTETTRTKMSGGTGVLPEGLLQLIFCLSCRNCIFNYWYYYWWILCIYRWNYHCNNFGICNFINLFLLY